MRVLAVTPTWGGELRPQMRASMKALRREGMALEWAVLNDNPWPPPDHHNVLHMYRQAQRRALAEGFDVLWTVEHDMVIPPDAALRLAETPGDVVYGVYRLRVGSTRVLNAFEYVNDKNIGESLSFFPKKLEAARKAGVVRVSGAGWGCTWIRRKALETIELPETWEENPPFDLTFAQRALRAKLQLYANFGVPCGHMKDDQMIVPFAADQIIKHNGQAWMIGGQLMPMYEEVRPDGLPVGLQPMDKVRVSARQTMSVLENGQSRRLVKGKEYDMPACDAYELSRAGYVEVRSGAIP